MGIIAHTALLEMCFIWKEGRQAGREGGYRNYLDDYLKIKLFKKNVS